MASRILFGSLMIVAVSGLLLLDHWTEQTIGFSLLVIAVVGGGLSEYFKLVGPEVPRRLAFALWGAGMLLILCDLFGPLLMNALMDTLARRAPGARMADEPTLHQPGEVSHVLFHLHEPTLLLFGILLVAMLAGAVLRGRPLDLRSFSVGIFGLLYVWFLVHFAVQLRLEPTVGEAAFVFYVVTTKATDIFAYFIGKGFGRHKLRPSISPGKTVEGALGGLVFGSGLGVGFAWAFELFQPIATPWIIAAAPAISITGQVGDLAESSLKRWRGQKDSARLFPGFGGILDIMDSLLLSAPVAYAFFAFVPRTL